VLCPATEHIVNALNAFSQQFLSASLSFDIFYSWIWCDVCVRALHTCCNGGMGPFSNVIVLILSFSWPHLRKKEASWKNARCEVHFFWWLLKIIEIQELGMRRMEPSLSFLKNVGLIEDRNSWPVIGVLSDQTQLGGLFCNLVCQFISCYSTVCWNSYK